MEDSLRTAALELLRRHARDSGDAISRESFLELCQKQGLADAPQAEQFLQSFHRRGEIYEIRPSIYRPLDLPRRGAGSHVAPTAIVGPNVQIGVRTYVWHFANLIRDITIGEDCMIGAYVQVDPQVTIGDRCRIQPHSIISTNTVLRNNVFIGAQTVITNAPYPPSKKLAQTILEEDVVLGSQVCLLPGITIGAGSVVGSKSLVTRSIPSGIVVMGIPARRRYGRVDYDAKMKAWERFPDSDAKIQAGGE